MSMVLTMNNIQWNKNRIAAKVQSGMLVIAMALLLGLMGWLVGGSQLAIVLIAAIIALFFVSPMMTPVFFWKINSGQRLSPDEAPQLFGILQKLSQRAGLNRLPVLFYLPTDAMLAFTVGQRHNAAIAVSEGLVRGLSRQELAAVLAHEVSHIRHNDTRMTAFAAMAGQVTGMLSVFGQFTLLLSLPLFLAGKVLFSWTAILLLDKPDMGSTDPIYKQIYFLGAGGDAAPARRSYFFGASKIT